MDELVAGVEEERLKEDLKAKGLERKKREKRREAAAMRQKLDALEALCSAEHIVDPAGYGAHQTEAEAEAELILARTRWLTGHVCKELASRNLSLAAAFDSFSSGGDRLTSGGLRAGLSALGIAIDTVAFDFLMVAFRQDRRGFECEEFCRHFEQEDSPAAAAGPKGKTKRAGKARRAGKAVRSDGLPERKRRSDGTPVTAAQALSVDSAAAAIAAAETPADDDQSKSQDQDDEQEDDDDGEDEEGETGLAAFARADRRTAADTPPAPAASDPAQSLLLRTPYTALHAIWVALPQASRAALGATCSEMRRRLGRVEGQGEGAVLRRLAFEGWTLAFFDDRRWQRWRQQWSSRQQAADDQAQPYDDESREQLRESDHHQLRAMLRKTQGKPDGFKGLGKAGLIAALLGVKAQLQQQLKEAGLNTEGSLAELRARLAQAAAGGSEAAALLTAGGEGGGAAGAPELTFEDMMREIGVQPDTAGVSSNQPSTAPASLLSRFMFVSIRGKI